MKRMGKLIWTIIDVIFRFLIDSSKIPTVIFSKSHTRFEMKTKTPGQSISQISHSHIFKSE